MHPMRWAAAAVVLTTAAAVARAAPELPEPSEGFLCCNMRVEDGWVSDINYRTESSRLIPAGTPIRATGYGRHRVKVSIGGEKMELGNDYSRKVPLRAFAQRYIVATDPTAAWEGLTPELHTALLNAQLTIGMTRAQVLVAVGYPIADSTPDLAAPVWKYWVDSEREVGVRFDAEGKVAAIEGDDRALVAIAPSLLTKDRIAAATAGERPCAVNVYRPNARHWLMKRVRPFVYVDDRQMGSLALGQSYCLALQPGTYHVSIREALLVPIPAWKSGAIRLTVEEGAPPVFLRYVKELGDWVWTPAGGYLSDKNDFALATEGQWRARE